MGISQIRGTPFLLQIEENPLKGTPKNGTPIFGNPQIDSASPTEPQEILREGGSSECFAKWPLVPLQPAPHRSPWQPFAHSLPAKAKGSTQNSLQERQKHVQGTWLDMRVHIAHSTRITLLHVILHVHLLTRSWAATEKSEVSSKGEGGSRGELGAEIPLLTLARLCATDARAASTAGLHILHSGALSVHFILPISRYRDSA